MTTAYETECDQSVALPHSPATYADIADSTAAPNGTGIPILLPVFAVIFAVISAAAIATAVASHLAVDPMEPQVALYDAERSTHPTATQPARRRHSSTLPESDQ